MSYNYSESSNQRKKKEREFFLRFFVNYLTIKRVFMVLIGIIGGDFMEIKNVILGD